MRLDEGGPGHFLFVLGTIEQAVLDHHAAHGLPGDFEAQPLEFSVDVAISPAGIVRFHSQDELADFIGLLGFGATLAAAVVFARHEGAVPAEEGFWGEERGAFGEELAADLESRGA